MIDPIAIKLAMVQEGVETATELAQRAGVNINTARAALKGGDVKLSTLGKIANALNRDARLFLKTDCSKLQTA